MQSPKLNNSGRSNVKERVGNCFLLLGEVTIWQTLLRPHSWIWGGEGKDIIIPMYTHLQMRNEMSQSGSFSPRVVFAKSHQVISGM